jgi:hypothetical protein
MMIESGYGMWKRMDERARKPNFGLSAEAISPFAVQANGRLSTVSTSVPTLGAPTCWHVVTPVAATVVGTNPTGSTNPDIAIPSDGKFLHTLNSELARWAPFAVNQDGTLRSLGDAGGLHLLAATA